MKRRRKKKPTGLRLFLVFFLLIVLLFILLESSTFDLVRVDIVGNETLSYEEIFKQAQLSLGESVVFLDSRSIKNSLESVLKIEQVRIKKIFPNELRIEIKERSPKAYIIDDQYFLLVDSSSLVYERADEKQANLCQIEAGFDLISPRPGTYLNKFGGLKISQFLEDFFQKQTYDIVKKLLLDEDSCQMVLKNDVQVEFGPYGNSSYKLAVLKSLNQSINEDESGKRTRMILLDRGQDPILVYE